MYVLYRFLCDLKGIPRIHRRDFNVMTFGRPRLKAVPACRGKGTLSRSSRHSSFLQASLFHLFNHLLSHTDFFPSRTAALGTTTHNDAAAHHAIDASSRLGAPVVSAAPLRIGDGVMATETTTTRRRHVSSSGGRGRLREQSRSVENDIDGRRG